MVVVVGAWAGVVVVRAEEGARMWILSVSGGWGVFRGMLDEVEEGLFRVVGWWWWWWKGDLLGRGGGVVGGWCGVEGGGVDGGCGGKDGACLSFAAGEGGACFL